MIYNELEFQNQGDKMDIIPKSKPTYVDYTERMNNMGWTAEHLNLTEKDITVYNNQIGNTGQVINFCCSPEIRYSVKGIKQCTTGEDSRTAYTLGLKLCNSDGVELSEFTKIRMESDKPTSDLVQLAQPFYSNTEMYSCRDKWYRFDHGFELSGGYYFIITVVAEHPEGGPTLPDIDIDSSNTLFSMEVDKWTH